MKHPTYENIHFASAIGQGHTVFARAREILRGVSRDDGLLMPIDQTCVDLQVKADRAKRAISRITKAIYSLCGPTGGHPEVAKLVMPSSLACRMKGRPRAALIPNSRSLKKPLLRQGCSDYHHEFNEAICPSR